MLRSKTYDTKLENIKDQLNLNQNIILKKKDSN
jgi:hypothetical protein